MSDPTLPTSPPSERNKDPILAVLRELLPPGARVLEVASGYGQHAEHFIRHSVAQGLGWHWQPTDLKAANLVTIAARCANLPAVHPPCALDVLAQPWPLAEHAYEVVYCANMLHISPWATCPALMRGAARHLAPGGALVLYGPYLVDGETPAAGNVAFDADLRARDPSWGLRRLAAVTEQAAQAGLHFERRVDLPANNLLLVFRLGGDDLTNG